MDGELAELQNVSSIARVELLLDHRYISLNLSATPTSRKMLEICNVCPEWILRHILLSTADSPLCVSVSDFFRRLERLSLFGCEGLFETTLTLPSFNMSVPYTFTAQHGTLFHHGEHIPVYHMPDAPLRDLLHATPKRYKIVHVEQESSVQRLHCVLLIKADRTLLYALRDRFACFFIFEESPPLEHTFGTLNNAVTQVVHFARFSMLPTLCGAVRTTDTKKVHLYSTHKKDVYEVSMNHMSRLLEMNGGIFQSTGRDKILVTLRVAQMLDGAVLIIVTSTQQWKTVNFPECDFVQEKRDLLHRSKNICIIHRKMLRHLNTQQLFRAVFIDEAQTFHAQTAAYRAFETLQKQSVFPILSNECTPKILRLIHPLLEPFVRNVTTFPQFISRYLVRTPLEIPYDINVIFLPMPEPLVRLHCTLERDSRKNRVRLFTHLLATLNLQKIDDCLSGVTFTILPDPPVPPFVTTECPVCLETLKNPVFTHCGHILCISCMRTVKTRCPLCRDVYTSPIQIYKHGIHEEAVFPLTEKQVAFELYLRTCMVRGSLILFTKHAQEYMEICKKVGNTVCVASRNIVKSSRNVEMFRSKQVDVLICMYPSLDFFNADHAVLIDMEMPIMLNHNVFVTFLLYEHSVEQYVYEKNKKTNLEWFCTRTIQGSRMYRIESLLQNVIRPWLQTQCAHYTLQHTMTRHHLDYVDDAHEKKHTWRFLLSGAEVTVHCTRSARKYTYHTLADLELDQSTIIALLTT
jgi:hypothetical protein